jgi:hypothetical protein
VSSVLVTAAENVPGTSNQMQHHLQTGMGLNYHFLV